MPMENFPTYKDEGDKVYRLLSERLRTVPNLSEEDIRATANFLAAAYQKSLEVQFAINSLLKKDVHDYSEAADLLALAEVAAGVLAQWHQESVEQLIAVIDQVRAQPRPQAPAQRRS